MRRQHPGGPPASSGATGSHGVQHHGNDRLSYALLTDPGRERTLNEDAALARDFQGGGLFAVADGMGGHAAGEVASQLALDELDRAWRHLRGPAPTRLAQAVQAANLAVYRHATGSEAGMGTTLTAVVVDGAAALIANVGDSRAYLYRHGTLTRLTRDHSWVAEQVRLGFLNEQEARGHQWRNVVSNALGSDENVRVDLLGVTLEPGDRILVCSDGLCGVIDDQEITHYLTYVQDLPRLLPELVSAANARGGPDNITAVVVDVHASGQRPPYALPTLQPDGPVHVSALGATRPPAGITYGALAVLYLTMLGMIVMPGIGPHLAVVGVALLTALLLVNRFLRRPAKKARPARGTRRGAR